ncbi:maltose permease [Fusarium phyllophilum]|uniref:Maltose permease n=1 Tax=Fusarium phyllophilum TaxID=47803 RepID=A0A8H5K3G8_9HYPO|nr:maltose permease [Fusarium phyllophilum]
MAAITDDKVARVSEDDHAPNYDMVKDASIAKQAAEEEHNLTLLQAIRKYPKAVMWSVLLSTSLIMEGYDIVLISSFFAQPSFREHYGSYQPKSNSWQITASWQNALSNAVSVGTIIGAFANGYFTYKFGYRKVLLTSLVAICGCIFISFFSPSLPVLLVGQFLCGIPWGVFATMAPAYASELISAGVQAGFSNTTGHWSYRIPFAIQWAWPVPLFIVLFFAPESPWYYVRIGDYENAEKSITRLSSSTTPGHAKQALAMMIHTNEIEKSIDQGTSYLDCFRGVDRRRTEIACMAFAAQPFCGSSMGGTPTFFFVQAGLPESISFRMSVGGLGIASVGTIISWWLLPLGRRTLYLWGLGLLTAVLMTVGFISVGAGDSQGGNYAQASMMLIWLGVYYMTVGPIICNVVNPYMLNPTAGNWCGKTGFFWGGCSFVFFIWTYFRLPETKDKTFEELDLLFANNVATREFAKYKVDAYAEDDNVLTVRDTNQR